jgi:hypothetical protein
VGGTELPFTPTFFLPPPGGGSDCLRRRAGYGAASLVRPAALDGPEISGSYVRLRNICRCFSADGVSLPADRACLAGSETESQ